MTKTCAFLALAALAILPLTGCAHSAPAVKVSAPAAITAPDARISSPVPATVPACEYEDGSGPNDAPVCRWDAGSAGNGIGSSFYVFTRDNDVRLYVYDDGHTESSLDDVDSDASVTDALWDE